jgi:hypothetical protein
VEDNRPVVRDSHILDFALSDKGEEGRRDIDMIKKGARGVTKEGEGLPVGVEVTEEVVEPLVLEVIIHF